MTSYSVGQKIELNDGRLARVRFAGTTSFQTGDWLGLELDEPTGKNDGSVKGERYFECEQGYGMFVRATGVRAVIEDAPKAVKRISSTNGVAAAAKSRPSSVHAAVNGVKKTDVAARRTSTITASPTPTARHTRMSSIRSPMKSPTKQLGTSSTPSTSTSRTSTPPVLAAKKPVASTAAHRPRPSIAGTTTAPTARPGVAVPARTRTSLAPAARAPATRTAAPARTASVRQSVQESADEQVTDDDSKPAETDESQDETDTIPQNFAPPPPIPQDAATKPSARRGSSPPASIHSQRTVRSSAVSSRHVEELEAKIRLLERKRQEDRDLKKSLDQAQQDRDKYQGIIEKLQKKYQPQQQEIADLKKALSEADSNRAVIENLQAEHDSVMEMATLDKEMAEETADALKAELDALRSRQEEMELELELLRDENTEFSKDMSAEERSSAGWLQLEKENERLRNALLRLRDLTQDREEELKSDLSEVQAQVKDYERISSLLEDTKEKLLTSESNADDLRQQLEAALGAEEMIEELTDRNMVLTERIDELKVAIADLEDLKELNDELEINHIEAEKQMQEEIDFKDALVLDRDRVARQQQAALDNADYTISRFRELVTQLQNDLQDMQASKQISETEAADLESRSRAMMDLNLRLQSSAAKTQVKTIDLELRKMEAVEASDHLDIVQLFLPDAFQSEHDSVLALLRFKRISFKASLLQSFMRERMTGTHSIDDNVFAFAEVHDHLTWIAGMAERFINTISSCSMEDFAKYESTQYELEPVERALNGYIDALRRDELDEIVMAQELQRSIAVMAHLSTIHIGEGLAAHSDALMSSIVFLQNQLEGIAASFTGIKTLIELKQKRSDADDQEDGSDSSFVTTRADALVTQARSIKVILGKSLKALAELHERSLTLALSCTEGFTSVESLSRSIAQYVRAIGQALRDIYGEEGREQPVPVDEIISTITRVATRAFDLPAQEAGPFTAVLGQLRSLSDGVADFAALLNDLDNTVEFERATAPWTARAEQLKQHKATAQDTEAELARTSENLREKDVTIRAKEAELEEQSVRIEMLEARMREASKRSVRIAELERVVHEAKDNERRTKQDLEKLKRDHAHEMERVRDELSRAAKRGQRSQSGSSVDGNMMGPGAQLAMKKQEHQITSLQSAVRYLKNENTRLRMPTATAPKALSQSNAWLYEPLLKPKTERQQRDAALQKAGKDILQSLQDIVLSAKGIDLTTIPENKLAWRPAKKSSRWQTETYKEAWATWRHMRDEFVLDVAANRPRVKQAA